MYRKTVLLLIISLAVVGGCRSSQLHKDQEQFRAHLQQMYTDQVMDNLILCHEGLPFIQLDYSKITGTITQSAEASLSDSQTVTQVRNFGPTLLLTSVARTISTVYGVTVKGSQQNQLTVTAEPVTNQPTVYRAYLEFLTIEGTLLESLEAPPEGAALICRQRCGKWYWVPIEHRKEFRELCLKTVALRGEAIESPATFDTKIVGVVRTERGQTTEENGVAALQQWEMTLRLAQKVPVDDGKTELVLQGQIYTFGFSGIDAGEDEKAKMDQIRINFVQVLDPNRTLTPEEIANGFIALTKEEIAKQVTGADVKLRLNRHRPPVSTTKDLLKSIEQEVQLQRLDNVRNR